MDFICSRPAVPQTVAAMKAGTWFVLWKHRGAPFGKLDRGSQLWLYETKSRQIRWKSRITKCVEFNYAKRWTPSFGQVFVTAKVGRDGVESLSTIVVGAFFAADVV